MASRDPQAKWLLVQLLAEQDKAKSDLCAMGYGCIGTPWPDVVKSVRFYASPEDA